MQRAFQRRKAEEKQGRNKVEYMLVDNPPVDDPADNPAEGLEPSGSMQVSGTSPGPSATADPQALSPLDEFFATRNVDLTEFTPKQRAVSGNT